MRIDHPHFHPTFLYSSPPLIILRLSYDCSSSLQKSPFYTSTTLSLEHFVFDVRSLLTYTPLLTMFVRSLLLGGTAALGASAMLVVPEMETKLEAIEDGFMNVHPMLFEDIRNAVVDVPCTECPFREIEKDGSVSWTDNKPSTLVRLSFQSLHGSSFFFLGHAWLTKNRLWTLPSMITA